MTETPAAFQCTYTPGLPELLSELGCSLLLSTYQAGQVIVLSALEHELIQSRRPFNKPLGLAVDGSRLAVATRHDVVVLANDARLALGYAGTPGHYDGLFVPRARYFVSEVDIHDMAWSGEQLWAVNTLFSCLCTVDHDCGFVPRWQPPFVTRLAAEDRCHLNGMAMAPGGGTPEYVTALGAADVPLGWKENRHYGGVLINVPSGEVVLGGLAMPHSPRLFAGQLFALLSLTGEVIRVDAERGTYDVVAQVPGFVRGLAGFGEYLFVGMSKFRPGRVLGDIPLDCDKLLPGVGVVHWPSGRVLGLIQYHSDCEEIYDIQVLPGLRRPGLVGLNDDLYLRARSTPVESRT